MLVIWEAVKSAFSNMTVFGGRANRKEFSLFLIFDVFAFTVLFLIAFLDNNSVFSQILNFPITALGIVLFIPSVSLIIRRFHDIEWHGLWLIFPFIGIIFLLPLIILWLVFSIFYHLTGLFGLIIWIFLVGLLPIQLFHLKTGEPMFYLLLGVPAAIYILFALILCPMRSQKGQNKYGEPSLNLYSEQYFVDKAHNHSPGHAPDKKSSSE